MARLQLYARRTTRIVAIALFAALAGCARHDSLELRQWTLATGASIELPTHLEADGSRPAAFQLRRTVELPAAFRGQNLTLAFAKLGAPAALLVNDTPAQPLDADGRSTYRVAGPQSFRVTAAQSAAGKLSLELTLANTWTQSAWIDVVPTLSATDGGDARFRFFRGWNLVTSVLGLVAAFVAALLFFSIFLFDRRRTDAGWFALETVCGALYPALNLNLLQPIAGTWDIPIAAVAVSGAGVAGVYMMHAYLGRGRPHPAWRWGWFAHACLGVAARDPFHSTLYVAATAGLFLGVAAVTQVVGYARARGTAGALTLSASWLGLLLLGGVDILAWMGFGSLFGGWQGAGIGIFMIAIAEALNLSRAHVRALSNADDLNRELRERLAALEASNREVGMLNEELRHQIKARTQELAEGFTRHAAETFAGAAQLSPGDVVGNRYRIEALLGSGGMGVVYRATRLTDGRSCALKVIKHARSPSVLARLSREAMVMADIVHPNVVRILDIEVSGSWLPYIVMELIEGTTLEQCAERFGKVDFGLEVMAQTASALEAVHARNFIHRDLKPGNIILIRSPFPEPLIKVVDFGLAGLLQTDRSSLMKLATTGEMSVDTLPRRGGGPLTESGMIFGTPMYMAPEYVAGSKEIGPPADIFSFGIIAYELLGGQRPFRELPITAAAHGRPLVPEIPLETLCAGLAPELSKLLLRCLSSSPAERPSAANLAAYLRGEARQEGGA